MIIQNQREEKTCCFYVSEFHLEMILVPYINKIIDEDITILTEKNLRETMEILISKMNLKEEDKEKILKLGWEKENLIKENSNIIIIGSKKYIQNKNEEIKNKNAISVLDCYDFEDIKGDMNTIINNYSKNLNTLGFSDITEN